MFATFDGPVDAGAARQPVVFRVIEYRRRVELDAAGHTIMETAHPLAEGQILSRPG